MQKKVLTIAAVFAAVMMTTAYAGEAKAEETETNAAVATFDQYDEAEEISVTLDEKVYALPFAPQELKGSGWFPNWDRSGKKTIGSRGYSHVLFEKGNDELTLFVFNASDEEMNAMDCETYKVSYVTGVGETQKVKILNGIIEVGKREEDAFNDLDEAEMDVIAEMPDEDGYRFFRIPYFSESAKGYEIGTSPIEGVWKICAVDESVCGETSAEEADE